MAQSRKRKRRSHFNRLAIFLVVLIAGFCAANSYLDKQGMELDLPSPGGSIVNTLSDLVDQFLDDGVTSQEEAVPVSTTPFSGDLEIHYLDMGQADSIFIRAPEKTVLIDAGENNQGNDVIRYLKEQGVETIDLLIGTHPHSDHIGGMDTVILEMDTVEIILPEIPEDIIPTTVTYTDLLLAIAQKQLKYTPAQPGDVFDLGGGAILTILGPVGVYGDLNNMSVVCRIDYGETSFLFTGDSSAQAEGELVETASRLRASLLDIGHHGSSSSTTQDFLDAVSPSIAVISCGLDNSYGHPSREVVERLQAESITIYRTDLQGRILIRSDGKVIQVETEK